MNLRIYTVFVHKFFLNFIICIFSFIIHCEHVNIYNFQEPPQPVMKKELIGALQRDRVATALVVLYK